MLCISHLFVVVYYCPNNPTGVCLVIFICGKVFIADVLVDLTKSTFQNVYFTNST